MRKQLSIGLALLTFLMVAWSNGCNVGQSLGDTCNALITENECIESTSCQLIGSCTQGYCCPDDPTTSSDPHCNGTLCPPVVDAGTGDDDTSPDDDAAAGDDASADGG